MQSTRDEELAGARREAMEAIAEMREYELDAERNALQCSVLKDEIRALRRAAELERMGKEVTDMEYLKCTIVKLLETGEFEALLPVVATLLKMSPEEVKRIRTAYETAAAGAVPLAGAAAAADSAGAWLSSMFGAS